MVVVPKKNRAICICVDLKPLNENIQQAVHPLPAVDDTLARLTGAKMFSTLDANSGFWQIPLEKFSRLLTTFLTPYGCYCFNKMSFGICSVPEHFQKQIEKNSHMSWKESYAIWMMSLFFGQSKEETQCPTGSCPETHSSCRSDSQSYQVLVRKN